jgi:nucleoside-diphosphate-sugar epimerase
MLLLLSQFNSTDSHRTMKKSCLIVGGSGFVGRHLTDALMTQNYKVRATYFSNPERLPSSGNDLETLKVDLCDKNEISAACQGVDFMFLSTNVSPYNMSKEHYDKKIYQINTQGVENAIQAATTHNIKKIVFMSSVAALGLKSGMTHYDESFRGTPEDAYGRSKLQAEQILLDAYRSEKVDTSILRPSAIYGKGDLGPLTKIVYFINKGLVPVMGDGENLQCATYVGNVVNAAIALMENKKSSGSLYLITDENAYTVNDLIRAVGKAMGKNYRMLHFPVGLLRCLGDACDFLRKISGHYLPFSRLGVEAIVANRVFRVNKIQKELSFSIEYDLQSGVRNTFL